MPSPFPGMDPYLEGSEWTSVHAELSSEIARHLAPKLRPKYVVRLARRFVSELSEDVGISASDIYPDAGLVPADRQNKVAESVATYGVKPLHMATVMPARVPHVSIEIRDVANRELVTAIELLLPTNKRGEGRKEYLEKRQRILSSTAHLTEIDLLRRGQRVPMQKRLPLAPYFIFLSRAERRPMVEVGRFSCTCDCRLYRFHFWQLIRK
jgi:hypothetical protein